MALISNTPFQARLAFAPDQTAPRGDVLVVIFLRGAADALNMIVPHGDERYYALRPTLNIPRPDDRRFDLAQRAQDLDGFFGLHPAMQALLPAWQAGHLAIVHACGAPDESRSHFQAMALMERGVDDERGPATGWIGRHLATFNNGNTSPMRAIAMGDMAPLSLSGSVPATAIRSITDFHLSGAGRDGNEALIQAANQLQQALATMYAPTQSQPLAEAGAKSLDVMRLLAQLNPARPRDNVALPYPSTDFGESLRQVAMLIRANVGLEVAALDLGGWDTHFAQGSTTGWMAQLLQELADSLAAFHADVIGNASAGGQSISIVVMSEFGRRAYENGSLGTDHGHAGAMLLLGQQVQGCKVHGTWPGLQHEQLIGPGDLVVTTDYRDVLAELCLKRLNNAHWAEVFPGYSAAFRGVFEPVDLGRRA